jgi:hypothetical protein
VPPPALVRAGLDALPSMIRTQGSRASRRFIELFTVATGLWHHRARCSAIAITLHEDEREHLAD